LLKLLLFLGVLLILQPAVGQTRQAPPLALKDLQGHSIRLDNHKGKVVLLNFWATWCPPCRAEIPDLIKTQRAYRSQGLRIIGITYPPEKISRVKDFVRKLKVNYPIALGTKRTKSLFTSSQTLPMTVIIDREGNIREVIEGIMFRDEFDQKVRPLLSSKSPRRCGTLVKHDFGFAKS